MAIDIAGTREFTEQEREQIHAVIQKISEERKDCPSPTSIKIHMHRMLGIVAQLLACKHSRPTRIGPYTYCDACGAIQRPVTSSQSIQTTEGPWEMSGYVRRMQEK